MEHAGGRGLVDVSAELPRGAVVALIGPSGAGKSTLLRLVAGEHAPDRGQVRTLGVAPAELAGAGYRAHAARVGLLAQADDLTEGLSVMHNVFVGRLSQWSTARALRNRVWAHPGDRQAVRDALASVGLEDRIDARPSELSGGERRRVALARLAFQAPQLWLADEPTTGLDVRLRAEATRLLLTLVRQAGASAIVALHELELLELGFDAVWGLREGKLVFARPPQACAEAELSKLFEAAR